MINEKLETIEMLIQEPVFKNFHMICQIPHPSFKEKELSDYLVNWAKDRNFDVYQDSYHNLLIKKPATLGMEDKEPILLQAHIDMVCEKSQESDHDFDKDPIKWVIDGDYITTGGMTTLGADNGIGVALALSILESTNMKHPAIEVLLTTAEEEDMSGALNFDYSLIKARRGINLDGGTDYQVIMGSSGGMGVRMTMPISRLIPTKNLVAYKLSISGLIGGHSGTQIHTGRGNANVLMGRLLLELEKKIDYKLADMKGGNFRLAIPREAEAVVLVKPEDKDTLDNVLEKFLSEVKYEHLTEKDSIEITSSKVTSDSNVISDADKIKLIRALILIPNGIMQLNSVKGVVDTSNNLGEVKFEESEITLVSEIRSATTSGRFSTFDKIEALADLIGFNAEMFAAYPGWPFNPDSILIEDIQKVAPVSLGRDVEILILHAGLECGCIIDNIPDMDMVCMGPNEFDLHAPTERVSISSTRKFDIFLRNIIENLS